MNFTLNEPILAWANLLFAPNDGPYSDYKEAHKWKREPALVVFSLQPSSSRREMKFHMELRNTIVWPKWYGKTGYMLFGVWLEKEGGEPAMLWSGTDYSSIQRIWSGSLVTLAPSKPAP